MLGSPNPFTTDGRYLLGTYVAIAAILPLMLERGLGWRLIVTAGVTVFVFSALYQFNSSVLKQHAGRLQDRRNRQAVAAFAQAQSRRSGLRLLLELDRPDVGVRLQGQGLPDPAL